MKILQNRLSKQMRRLIKINRKLIEREIENRKDTEEVMHHLKAPLSNIKIYVELLRLDIGEKIDQEKWLLEIEDQIMEVVHRIHMLRRQELKDKEKLALQNIDGLEYLKSFIHKYRENLARKELSVSISGENIPILIDIRKMDIVLENLIMNAIYYAKPGGCILLKLKKHGQDVQIIMEDTGKGIQCCDVEQIFFRGFTTEDSHSGLGLSIASNIIKEHKGSIKVKSFPQKGSVFTIQMPYERKCRL